MTTPLRVLLFVIGLSLLATGAMAQTFDLRFVVMNNDGTHYDVKVQAQANGSTFKMGSANFMFLFNSTALGFPTLLAAHNFSGASYLNITIGGSGNSASINVELKDEGFGTELTTEYMDVATIRFAVTNPDGNSALQWDPAGTVVFKDDESTQVNAGTLNNLNTSPLPVQLASFTATVQQETGGVLLKWSTASETNNYGFEVQKAQEGSDAYQTIPNSFVAGNGTTVEPHFYSFTDATVTAGVWYYRLKQTDLDGAVRYSEGIRPVVTGVADRPLPTAFALDQNYPNPFNPSTTIEFALPRETHVMLEIYNVLGQRVATLVDDVRPAGYYAVPFNASDLASGLYVYRFVAGETTMVRKMMLTK